MKVSSKYGLIEEYSRVNKNSNIEMQFEKLDSEELEDIYIGLLRLFPPKLPDVRAARNLVNFNRIDKFKKYYRCYTIYESTNSTIPLHFYKPKHGEGILTPWLEEIFKEIKFPIGSNSESDVASLIEGTRWRIIFTKYETLQYLIDQNFFNRFYEFYDNLDSTNDKKYCRALGPVKSKT